MHPIVIDFETEAIDQRPKYPPRPVGVAIWEPGRTATYLAWGHPIKNNCSADQAKDRLRRIWKSGRTLLFHNAKFDLDVAETHLGLKVPSWEQIHDTLFLLFLKNPHALSLSLKPAAEALLGMKPEERDAVKDWLIKHNVIARNQGAGPYISKAPGDVVGKYAIGDVVRTRKLFLKLYPELDEKIKVAYDRERRLLPILLQNERQGIRFDVNRAEQDLKKYEAALQKADAWLRKRLGAPGLNFDADQDVGAALDKAKVVTEWTWTKGGHGRAPQRSVAKNALGKEKFRDLEVFRVLGYRNRLQTVLSLNLRPWLEMATVNKGYVFTEWNQVRQSHGNDQFKGARTGRLSCSRFQNISKNFYDKGDGYEHPTKIEVPELPLVRVYLLPDKGEIFCHRDYKQQEFRILAHYEDGDLKEAYQSDPKIDYHDMMQARIKDIAQEEFERRLVKTLNFGILYGMGAALLALRMGKSLEVAKRLRVAAKRATPGVMDLDEELKERGRKGKPIRTWGGRLYYCEPPAFSKKHGREMSFEYKLLNYLIQGSAADCTKEAIIRYHDIRKHGRMLVTVHDEINLSVPRKFARAESGLLKKAMESIEFDVPMLTDAKYGRSWGELK